jgi:transcriptional regulator with XRE-family HTH domain
LARHRLITDPELRAEIGARMKRARENAKLTPAETARALGVAEVSARYWETGRSFPSVEHLTALHRLYRVSFDGLLCRTSEEEFQEDLFLGLVRGLGPKQRRAIAHAMLALTLD